MSPLHPLYWWDLFKRYPVAVSQGFLAVLLALSNWFIFLDHAELGGELEGIAKSGKEVLTNVSNSPVIRQQAITIRSALTYLDANLVVADDRAQNVGYFYSFEEGTGAKISDLNQMLTGTVPEGAAYVGVGFSLRGTGDFGQNLALVHAIETGRFPAKISKFIFFRREDGSDLIELNLNLVLLGKP
jgi:hypothetical protein